MSPTHSQKSFLAAASPLFLILFIDGMGLGLVFPLLNALIMDPSGGILAHSVTANMRNFIFGAIIGIFMLCWFFGAAFLGDLSDQIGRKKSLLICLFGSFLGYLLSAFAVIVGSFSLLILGRIVAGFTSGSQPIAQAAIVDISEPEHKTRNISFILFALSLGFVFGPLLGGVLSDPHLFKGFSFSTPFFFAAIISFLNVILLQWLFKETFKTSNTKMPVKFHRAIEVLVSAFRYEKIRGLSFMFLIFIFGWSGFYSFISMYLFREFHFSTLETSLFMGLLGVGFGVGSFLTDYFTQRYTLKKSVMWSAWLTAFLVFLIAITHQAILAWIVVAPIGGAAVIAYSSALTLFSNQVSEEEQGWVMGVTGSIMAFAFGMNALLTGVIASAGNSVPLIVSFLCLALSGILFALFYKKSK